MENRVMASPMWQYEAETGAPTDWHLMNVGRLADGGRAGIPGRHFCRMSRLRYVGRPWDLGRLRPKAIS